MLGGSSPNSSQVSAQPIGPPAAPTGVTATAGNAQVTLSWTASAGATSYTVERATMNGGTYTAIASGVTTTSYTNTGLTNGTTYYYVIVAVNAGGSSPNSSQVSAQPIAPPAAPTGVTATAGNAQVTLSWTASAGATSYTVERATMNGGTYTAIASGVTTTSYTNTGLTNGTTYYYVIVAVNAGGSSPNSSQVSAQPIGPPAAPTGVTATAGNAQVTLSWTASAGATSYTVERATMNGGTYTAIASGVTTTSYTNTGLTNGTTYYYVIVAVNAGGSSPNSSQVSAQPIGPPAAPTGVTATAGNAQVTLSWTASAGATSYTVERATTNGGTYTAIASGVTTTSYTNTGLTNGTTYYYVIVAVNAGGSSPNSSQVSAQPIASSSCPDWGDGDGGQCAGDAELDGECGCDQLHSRAGDDEWRYLHSDCERGDDHQLYEHRVDERNDLLLCHRGGECWGQQPQFQPGERAAYRPTGCADRSDGDGGECAGDAELDSECRCDQLHGRACDGERRSLHSGGERSDDDQLYKHGLDERNDLLLCRRGGECWGQQPQLQPGERPAGRASSCPDWCDSDGGQCAGDAELDSECGCDQLHCRAGDDERRYLYSGGERGDDDQLYEHRVDEWNDLLLCRRSGECWREQPQFQPGERAAGRATGRSNGLTATAGNAQVTLSWTASAGATSYTVERATVNGGTYTAVASGVTTTSYTNTGLTNGTTYYYVVAAVNAGGSSPNSSQVSAQPTGPPAAPTGLTATAGNGQVTLSWTASAGAVNYKVERATVSGGPYAMSQPK